MTQTAAILLHCARNATSERSDITQKRRTEEEIKRTETKEENDVMKCRFLF